MYTKGEKIMAKVISFFNEIREGYKNITDEELDSNGAIYYMNGNDGTDFDWDYNDRLCEFFIFHKNEKGFIKLLVNRDDTMDAYVYPDGEMSPSEVCKKKLCNGEASFLKKIFLYGADYKNIYDEHIDKINYRIDVI